MSTEPRGIYGKYRVSRVDGRDRPGGDKAGAQYYVLDYAHDPYSRAALLAYADACDLERPELAANLRTVAAGVPTAAELQRADVERIVRERVGEACTGVTARWCPVHGDCSCTTDLEDSGCPLHGAGSTHAEGVVFDVD